MYSEAPSSTPESIRHDEWSPAARVLFGVAGAALATATLRSEGRLNARKAVLGVIGAALVVRSVTNMPFERLLGVAAMTGPVTVRKSIVIAAPIHEVFNWLVAWERWPHWTSHVRVVRSHGRSGAVGERTHWEVDGPAGTTVEWDAETTGFVPPTFIAWRTIESSSVSHAGTITLSSADGNSTRVDVTMDYRPVAGRAGQAVASLLRRNPRRRLDDDLARLKTTIETGRPPHDAAIRDFNEARYTRSRASDAMSASVVVVVPSVVEGPALP
jgi:uncharacterized membrane protein